MSKWALLNSTYTTLSLAVPVVVSAAESPSLPASLSSTAIFSSF